MNYILAVLMIVSAPTITGRIKLKMVNILSKRIEASKAKLIGYIIQVVLYAIIIILTASVAGLDLSTLIGAAGVLTLAVSFSMQTIITNLISGFIVLLEQRVKLGDTILVNKETGSLIEIGFVSTTLLQRNGVKVRVPNGDLLKYSVASVNTKNLFEQSFEVELPIDAITSFKQNVTKTLEKLTDNSCTVTFKLTKIAEKTPKHSTIDTKGMGLGVIRFASKEKIADELLYEALATTYKKAL